MLEPATPVPGGPSRRLPQLAEFICRNLPFAAHVALMGMEMYGYVHLNLNALWIDPFDYRSELEEATLCLALHGMNASIYNHQLCAIPKCIRPFARKPISDWKDIYLEECTRCGARPCCGGFFQSATERHSAQIAPVRDIDASAVGSLCRAGRKPPGPEANRQQRFC